MKIQNGKKIKIIFIIPDLHAGGAERIITTIANHLNRDLFEPKIILLRKEGYYLDILKDDVKIISINTQRIRNSLFPILKSIRKERPNIVFSGFGEINAYLSPFIPFFKKTKFIARETNVVSEHVTRKEILFFYRFYNNYHKIICQSDDMKNDLLENFKIKPEKVIKINNPVDFDFIEKQLKSAPPPKIFTRDYKHVVAVGNLSARKGFDRLLNVFAYLINNPIKLHIIGDGKDKEQLLKIKKERNLENVIFHGMQKNPYPYLKYADLFVLSSRYEGFPNVLLEAGACGTYSLANNCPGGISEIIQHGINGEIADITKYFDFSKIILEILEKKIEKNAIQNSIKNRFSKEIILEKYYQLFEEILR